MSCFDKYLELNKIEECFLKFYFSELISKKTYLESLECINYLKKYFIENEFFYGDVSQILIITLPLFVVDKRELEELKLQINQITFFNAVEKKEDDIIKDCKNDDVFF